MRKKNPRAELAGSWRREKLGRGIEGFYLYLILKRVEEDEFLVDREEEQLVLL